MSEPSKEITTSVENTSSIESQNDGSLTLGLENVKKKKNQPSLIHERGSNGLDDDNDDDDDFDDFTEFASASENIIITQNAKAQNDPAAIDSNFADFSKCDTPQEHNRVSINEISNVFASTFGSSMEDVSSLSVAQEPTTNTHVQSNGKHLSHWLNDSR